MTLAQQDQKDPTRVCLKYSISVYIPASSANSKFFQNYTVSIK